MTGTASGASSPSWAPSTPTGPTDRGRDIAHELPVYLGDGWPVLPAALATTARDGLRAGARQVAGRFPSADEAVGAVDELSGGLAVYRASVGVDGVEVWPGTRLELDGLAAALRGGRFSVTGFAAFDPAVPFDPAPVVPDALPRDEDFTAVQFVHGRPEGYTHPDDAP